MTIDEVHYKVEGNDTTLFSFHANECEWIPTPMDTIKHDTETYIVIRHEYDIFDLPEADIYIILKELT